MSNENRRWILTARPTGLVDSSVVQLRTDEAPEPGPDEALVRVRYLSIDPTIRTQMNDAKSYVPPIEIGATIRGYGIGKVLESKGAGLRAGDLVFGLVNWQDYAVLDARVGSRAVRTLPEGIEPTLAVNVFGVTGVTAYFGLLDIGALKEGDTVVVSGAAGATGSTAGQIARIKGAGKVIGIAGSAKKCAYVTGELGFDAAIDYRCEDVGKRLGELCPEGIDLYFDNVGGAILDACLAHLAMRGRIVLCGAISAYNSSTRPPGPSNYSNMISRRGRMQGFIVTDFVDRFPEAYGELATWLGEGKLSHAEHVVDGLERAPEALNMLFSGENLGKVVVAL